MPDECVHQLGLNAECARGYERHEVHHRSLQQQSNRDSKDREDAVGLAIAHGKARGRAPA
jgi:hypothetical protein